MLLPNACLTRREVLKTASCGFGYLALASLCTERAAAEYQNPLAPKTPHFKARAKRIIFLSMRGGPSHVDTFDYKPKLAEDAGKAVTALSGQVQDRNRGRSLLPSPFEFKRSGQSGLPISELFPHVGQHADDLCLLNSMYTDVPNHPQSWLMLHTGEFRFTRPSMGAWLLYGLGTENQDLPGYITISPPADLGGAQNYGNGFLPASFQGTRIGQQGTAVAGASIGNITNADRSGEAQRRQIDFIQAMNQDLLQRKQVNPELEGVINSMELGFRMQHSLPQLLDISKESQATLDLYGIAKGRGAGAGNGKNANGGNASTDDFGRQCLLARRFCEAGVRFVEVSLGNWDTHGGLKSRLTSLCGQIDKPIGGLLTDLKQRGLLQDTLVLWGGEFGRTPTGQGTDGRDHNSAGFSMWLAGGGVKGGMRYGATDEHGSRAVENKLHHHDLHATLLHLMGLDHQKLSYRYGGRDYTLTDIHGRVAKEIMA
ncbi:MAG: DUF1501 domain-containing protein [Planctomycetia bacterium]|nr:DUF1501 domain-containing protein [Planctomycetia bacterium]